MSNVESRTIGGISKIVRVHIDQQSHESPNPTTGEALYRLGQVPAGRSLYLEVDGDQEDTMVEDGPDAVLLREDAHFHSAPRRTVTIVVEGTPHEWSRPRIRYAEVVTLFDPGFPQHPDVTYSVTYDHGPRQNPEGILAPGGTVRVKEKMVFHVSRTGQS